MYKKNFPRGGEVKNNYRQYTGEPAPGGARRYFFSPVSPGPLQRTGAPRS